MQYITRYGEGDARLKADTNWRRLEPEQRENLLRRYRLTPDDAPRVNVENDLEVLATLDRLSLSGFADRFAALGSRFDAVITDAAQLMEPKARVLKLPSCTIKESNEIEAWLTDTKEAIVQALLSGPVIIQ